MIDQMVERFACYRYSQLIHVRKIALAQLSGLILLGEKHLFRGSFQGSPYLDPSLQCPQLSIRELAGVAALQILK
ncbi:hypothetical protein ES703_121227 [subsurface metagenome]